VTRRRRWRRRGGGQENGDSVENWIKADCCHLEFYQCSLMPKRSSDIMADEFENVLSRIFICNFQFRQTEPLAAAL